MTVKNQVLKEPALAVRDLEGEVSHENLSHAYAEGT